MVGCWRCEARGGLKLELDGGCLELLESLVTTTVAMLSQRASA